MTVAGRETRIESAIADPELSAPSFRRSRVCIALFTVFIALAVVARWQWGRIADDRLNATIAALRTRGIPTRAIDFEVARPSIPDAQNAALVLHDAALAVRMPSGLDRFSATFVPERQWSLEAERYIPQIVAANGEAVRLAQSAMDRPGVDWQLPTDPAVAATGVFAIVERPAQETLAQVLRETAILEHRRGNDAEAIEDLLALFRVADAALAGPPTLQSYGTACAIAYRAVVATSSIEKSLHVDAGDADRARLLLNRLCDERPMKAAAVLAMYGEAYLGIVKITTRRFPFGPSLLVRPMYLLDADRLLRMETDAAAPAIACDSYSAAMLLFPDRRVPSHSILYVATRTLSDYVTPWLRAAVDMQFELLPLRRRAAVSLAVKLFEFDHHRPPYGMDELVPRYLPNVPVDGRSGVPMSLP